MFLCPECGSGYQLPACGRCGHRAASVDGIWQLSDDPDIVTAGEGDKYIGYEYIGESYSGGRLYTVARQDLLFAGEISKTTGPGIFLDLGCGDGCLTVPAARNGTRVIAADISNGMLRLLRQKAHSLGVSLERTVLCRANALRIPLEDNAVDCVVCNSVLHLISRPERVLGEIRRVLKPGGCFLAKDDRPGRTPAAPFDNSRYEEIVNTLYTLYWQRLREQGIQPKKYSWQFDREALCAGLFTAREETVLPVGTEYSNKLKDGFLLRFAGRGFSDQVDVPPEPHREALALALARVGERYGEDFAETAFHGIEPDLAVVVYRK